ncbi:hypothetical protein GUITHDRAFT_146635 [Guillardia theta CCMP2712]|uniref:Nucleotide-diphospho-sugar transferase domain-containing protein n=1 Tax=Guillardia theta (strain CCMP2712) TaxID=905079 RepID=L1IH27_GUITC|nr:hypothetical protein GUITHDRAFT_146635 [Guillardia theta CCMP2712]EKX35224.1 hypothetical protein GUITHDRAFT_146635 [Guillardia theta CCMP2712]|eukprot:XP_005822204.1 hypothetical protein GUITHDRAFT_146635 [Guillardia theta CCMP2712]
MTLFVFADSNSRSSYARNIESLSCYSKLNSFNFVLFRPDSFPQCKEAVGFFFRKVCHVFYYLLNIPADHHVAVLDADTAIVNFDKKIQAWLVGNKDIWFYHRFHNNEVMAGNYIVRNTAWSRRFLLDWYMLHPGNKHEYSGMNADNGALHWLLLHRLVRPVPERCRREGKGSDYPKFVACFHAAANNSGCRGGDWERVGFFRHGEGWAYDGWVIRYRWSNTTFMHHAMKNPVIGGQYEGRLLPPRSCEVTSKLPADRYMVSEGEMSSLLRSAALTALPGRKNHGYNPNSCIVNVRPAGACQSTPC